MRWLWILLALIAAAAVIGAIGIALLLDAAMKEAFSALPHTTGRRA
jgi:type VI protein secretion system component VasF